MVIRYELPKGYRRACPKCRTEVSIDREDMDWNRAMIVKCPICGSRVVFSDSYGFLFPEVEIPNVMVSDSFRMKVEEGSCSLDGEN